MDVNSFVIGYSKGKKSGKGFYSTKENDAGGMTYVFKATESGGGGDLAFNIHYGTEAPTDTSKLWVKASEPSKVVVAPQLASVGEREDFAPPVTLSEKLPTNNDNMRCAAVGTKIYLFGGNPQSTYLNTVYCFDTENEKVTTLSAKLPTAAGNAACAAVGTKIYLFGGKGKNYLKTINCFDTENETITTLSASLPVTKTDMACAAVGTKIYLFGGFDSNGTRLDTIHRFDTETNTLATLSTVLPGEANGIACAAVGTKIYLIGGMNDVGVRYNTINCFDTETEEIVTLSAKLPVGTQGMGCAAVGTKIYLIGGLTDDSLIDTINCFDAATGTIVTSPYPFPYATNYMGCEAVGMRVYAFGGGRASLSELDTIICLDNTDYLLLSGTLQIIAQTSGQMFVLVDTSTFVWETGLKKVYKGDETNKPEQVEAYLYNETTSAWELI